MIPENQIQNKSIPRYTIKSNQDDLPNISCFVIKDILLILKMIHKPFKFNN